MCLRRVFAPNYQPSDRARLHRTMNTITVDSNVRKIRGEITWAISVFAERRKAAYLGQVMTSPSLTIHDPTPGLDEPQSYRFRLQAYLKGTAKHQNAFLLYIQSQNEDTLLLKYRLFILNRSGAKVCQLKNTYYFKSSSSSGLRLPRFLLSTWFRSLFKSNTLTVGCKVTVMVANTVVREEQYGIPEPASRLGDQLFSRMRENVMTDLTLVCGDKRMPCHKVVMVAQSTVFQDMFRLSEDGNEELVITEMTPEVLEKVLEFVYLDKVEIGADAKDLFLAGDKYNISGLKHASELALVKSLTASNVSDVLVMFDVHGCNADLNRAACRFAAQNMAEVLKTEDWARVVAGHQKVVNDVFQAMAGSQEAMM